MLLETIPQSGHFPANLLKFLISNLCLFPAVRNLSERKEFHLSHLLMRKLSVVALDEGVVTEGSRQGMSWN